MQNRSAVHAQTSVKHVQLNVKGIVTLTIVSSVPRHVKDVQKNAEEWPGKQIQKGSAPYGTSRPCEMEKWPFVLPLSIPQDIRQEVGFLQGFKHPY